MSHSR